MAEIKYTLSGRAAGNFSHTAWSSNSSSLYCSNERYIRLTYTTSDDTSILSKAKILNITLSLKAYGHSTPENFKVSFRVPKDNANPVPNAVTSNSNLLTNTLTFDKFAGSSSSYATTKTLNFKDEDFEVLKILFENNYSIRLYLSTNRAYGLYPIDSTLTIEYEEEAPLISLGDSSQIQIVNSPSQEYSGQIFYPKPTVKCLKNNEWITLEDGWDYLVMCDTDPENVGEYYYSIKGLEEQGFTGTVSKDSNGNTLIFKITPVNLSATTISINPEQFNYTGSSQTPEITISYPYLYINPYLIKDKDYSVSYSREDGITGNNITIEPGDITITLTGKGNFTGSEKRSYSIVKNLTPISDCIVTLNPSSIIYNNDTIINGYFPDGTRIGVIVTDNGVKLREETDYICTFPAMMVEAGKYTITISAVSGSNYSGTTTAIFTIGKKSFTIDPIPDQIYTGNPVKPSLTIDNGTIVDDKFSTVFSNNINVGTATVVVTAIDSLYYTGSASSTFNIIKDQRGQVYINVNGSYVPAVAYINIGGVWKECTAVYVNKDGTWHKTTTTT